MRNAHLHESHTIISISFFIMHICICLNAGWTHFWILLMPADCSYVNAVNIGIIIEQSLRLNVKRARRQQQKNQFFLYSFKRCLWICRQKSKCEAIKRIWVKEMCWDFAVFSVITCYGYTSNYSYSVRRLFIRCAATHMCHGIPSFGDLCNNCQESLPRWSSLQHSLGMDRRLSDF